MSNISNLESDSVLSELNNLNESNNTIVAALKPGDYVQMNVNGDGNCFYRALYHALKHHTIPKLLTRFFACIFAGDDANKPADPETMEEDEFWLIVRSKLGKEILKENGIMEAQASTGLAPGGVPETIYDKLKEAADTEIAVRATDDYIALIGKKETAMNEIKKHLKDIKTSSTNKNKHAENKKTLTALIRDIESAIETKKSKSATRKLRASANNTNIDEYNTLLRETTEDLKTTTKEVAKLSKELDALQKDLKKSRSALNKANSDLEDYLEENSPSWAGYIGNMPHQIRDDPLVGSPESYETLSKTDFKKAIVKYLTTAVNGSWMYASDFDTYLLRFLMGRCENPIVIDLIPANNTTYKIREINSNGVPQVHLFLIQGNIEHYNFIVREDKYKEQLRGEDIERVIDQQHVRAFHRNTVRNAAARGLRNATAAAAARELRKAAAVTRKNKSPSPRTKAAIAAALANSNNIAPAPAPAPALSKIERLRKIRAAAPAASAKPAAPAASAASAAPAAPANSPARQAAQKMGTLMSPLPLRRSARTAKKRGNNN